MAVVTKLFCIHCYNKELWKRSWDTKVECRVCGKEYEKEDLRHKCAMITERAETVAVCRRYAESWNILMSYMYNSITGKCLALF